MAKVIYLSSAESALATTKRCKRQAWSNCDCNKPCNRRQPIFVFPNYIQWSDAPKYSETGPQPTDIFGGGKM